MAKKRNRKRVPKNRPKSRKRVVSRKRNPVRVSATVTGKGTGWIKARAVRIVKKGGVSRVEVKR